MQGRQAALAQEKGSLRTCVEAVCWPDLACVQIWDAQAFGGPG